MEWALDLASGRRNSNRSVATVPNAPSDYEISHLFERFFRFDCRAPSREFPVAEYRRAPRSAHAEHTTPSSGSNPGDRTEMSVWASHETHESCETHGSYGIRQMPIRSFPLDSSGVAQRVLPTVKCIMQPLILPYQLPDAEGHFGPFGGVFVPETLMPAIEQLGQEYEKARNDPEFSWKLEDLLRTYCGRPTPLYFAERLTKELGGPRIYLKREDLLHTGAHKINNAIGQALLAVRMGKQRLIAETGAGQHGVATATVAARFGLECVVYMGKVDMERQALNVARMEFLGATVVPVSVGQATLKEAINEAMRDWVTNVRNTHYLLGTAYGPHPYPMMVRDFHRIIGEEARRQILAVEEKLPDLLVACVGGGSNAIGLFYPFLEDENVRMVGVEAGGRGIRPGEHAARFQTGCLGVLQGTKTWLLADDDGQNQITHSVSPCV